MLQKVRYVIMSESDKKQRIVVIGGGTGTHTVLRGLKQYQAQVDLTAIVTMADAGGSTGRLRDEFGYLPVGDARMALAALASDDDEHDELVRQLFLHRFSKGEGLSGHNVGNLLLVALTDLLGSEEAAIRAAARVLRVRGSVIPVTTESVQLVATYADGAQVMGEHLIDEPLEEQPEQPIASLSVTPAAAINPKAEAAILDADVIILGPGDLYTSVLANCVVDGVADALRHTPAKVLYVSNLMTKRGQTTGMGVQEHIDELIRYTGRTPDAALVNTGTIDKELCDRYAAEGEYPVEHNLMSVPALAEDFLARGEVVTAAGDTLKRSLVRHDSRKVARAILDTIHGTERLL